MKDQIQKFLAYHPEKIYFSLKYDMKFFKQLANELSEYCMKIDKINKLCK